MSAYLDHAASTPMRPEAIDAMQPWLRDQHANPSGAHRLARQARRALDEARDAVAEALGADPGDVVFTSGGTEADNLAVLGVHDRRGGAVVSSAIEHHAVLDPVVARDGRLVAVDGRGVIDLDALAVALDDDVTLVSVMLANNEVGTIQPLDAVAELVRRLAPTAAFHTDAVQGAAWLDVATAARPADLVSVSGHKVGGPKGIGALVVRRGTALAPRQLGGGQERDRRGGTHDLAGIVAFATALTIATDQRAATATRVSAQRDRLADGLRASIPDVVEAAAPDGDRSGLLPGTCHLCIPGVESEALLFLLDRAEVSASAASSCASGAMEPSHVLAAMGVSRSLAFGSLRLSLGWTTTDAEIDHALEVIPPAVARLRRFSTSVDEPGRRPIGGRP